MYLRTHAFITALLVMSTGVPGCVSVSRQVDPAPPPPTRDQIAGTYFGFSSFSGYRLDLFSDGTGALATASIVENGVVRRYESARWDLDGSDLSATFVAVDAKREPVYLRAVALPDPFRDVSISLSPTGGVPVGEFTRESRVKEWQRLLTPPDIGSEK